MDIFLLFLGVFLLLTFIRVPIAFSIGAGAALAIVYSEESVGLIAPVALSSLDAFAFLAIPAFIFAGNIMASTGISSALIDWFLVIFGRVKGSLGAVAVLASAMFGAVTGSAMATVTAIGTTIIPEMVRVGYKREYAVALVSASGFLGILIPPSIPGIMYALSTGSSIASVWLSTVGPGIVLAASFIVLNYFIGTTESATDPPKFSLSKLVAVSPKFLVAIMMPVIIFVGIYGGIFTPTEAGAAAVAYGVVAGWLIFRYVFKEKRTTTYWDTINDSAVSSAAITLIIAFAGIAGRIITLSNVPNQFTQFVLGYTDSRIVFLLMINVVLLFLGMIMEPNTTILILAPILAPAAQAYGIDVVQLGAIMVLNLGIGMITPPFAATLYVGCKIGNIRFDQIVRPVLPFFLVSIPVLMLTSFWSALSLFLPESL